MSGRLADEFLFFRSRVRWPGHPDGAIPVDLMVTKSEQNKNKRDKAPQARPLKSEKPLVDGICFS